MKVINVGLLFLMIIYSSSLRAQQSSFGTWVAYFGNAKLNDKWSLLLEAQHRAYNIVNDREQLLLRTAAIYDLGNKVNIALGYAYVNGRSYNGNNKVLHSYEHRVFQQLQMRQQFGRVNLLHRYRIEERFFKNDTRLRFRYFLYANIAVNRKEMRKGTVYLSAYNEVFLHTDTPTFDRDRVFVGAGYVFNDQLKLEAGPMVQLRESTSRGQLNIMLFHNFKL